LPTLAAPERSKPVATARFWRSHLLGRLILPRLMGRLPWGSPRPALRHR